MKIAAVSEDGITISQHFGRAPFYIVVTVETKAIVSKEKRKKMGHAHFAGEPHAKGEDPRGNGFVLFWAKFLTTIISRQTYLEMELAQAKGIPVHRIVLAAEPPVPIRDFSQTQILLDAGYRQMKTALVEGKISSSSQLPGWLERMMHWIPFRRHALRSGRGKNLKAGKAISI